MPSTAGAPQTLYDKILADHIVDEKLDGTILLYIGMSPHQLRLDPRHPGLHCLRKQTDISSTKSHHR